LWGKTSPPYKYRGPRPIEVHHPIDQMYLPFIVSYLLLSLPNFSNLLFFVLPSSPRRLKAFYVALPTLELPYVRLPDGILPGRRSKVYRRNLPATSLTGLPHRSDRCRRRGAATAAFAWCWLQKMPTHPIYTYIYLFPDA
jgi:hypothetical protein